MTASEFQVTGMSCGHCEMSVRDEVTKVAGVDAVDVSAATGRLVVTSQSPVDADAVLAAVGNAGYSAVPA